eukprot:364790-Chlamydomonas_euryale.AAC.9
MCCGSPEQSAALPPTPVALLAPVSLLTQERLLHSDRLSVQHIDRETQHAPGWAGPAAPPTAR